MTAEPAEAHHGAARLPHALERPVVAALVLGLLYVGASFLLGDHGSLGTDTGSKVVTLEAMSDDLSFDADIGYWAEDLDPDGDLHPVYYTEPRGDRWVNVSTFPMLYAATPLYAVGGYRLALLLPMAGAVAAALAARALAARVGARRPPVAFWVLGLASPVAIYALDLWEHAIGSALLLWAAVLAVDAVRGAPLAPRALGVGVLVGVGFTMRTEALLYGAVLTATACLVLLHRRVPSRALAFGAIVAGGTAAMAGLNHLLEVAAVGEGIRFSRSAGAAASGGAQSASVPGSRSRDSLMTTFQLEGDAANSALLLGIVFTAALVWFVLKARDPSEDARRVSLALAALVAVAYLARFVDGLGFVPGFVPAAPLAAAGAALAVVTRRPAARVVAAAAVASLPLVWWFQYVGGAAPQWGGRYVLPTTVALVVVGVALTERLVPWARTFLLGASVAVTVFGLAWLVDRSHGVERMEDAVAARSDDLLISRVAHVFREAGAVYDPGRRWLTAVDDEALADAAAVGREIGAQHVAVIQLPDRDPPELRGYDVVGREDLAFIVGEIDVFLYERTN